MPADRRAERALAWHAFRRSVKGALALGLASAITVAVSFTAYRRRYDTAAEREAFARSLAGNDGAVALLGAPFRIDTIGGFVAWRALGVLVVVGAVWALVAASNAFRGDEDAGRWELVLASATTKARATVAVLVGLFGSLAVVAAPTAIALFVTGVHRGDVDASGCLLLLACVLAAPALLFAVGALCSQVAPTRGRALALGGGVLGVLYGLRVLADSAAGLSWLRWATPFGWILEARPLAGDRSWALVPVVVLVLAASATTAVLAGRRDLEGSLWPEPTPRSRPGPSSALGLARRLVRGSALGWITSFATAAFVFGVISAGLSSTPAPGVVGQRGPTGYLGTMFVLLATVLAVAATGAVAAIRREEETGRLDVLVAAPVGRVRWLVGRAGVAVTVLLATGAAAGVAAVAGNALGGGDQGLSLVGAGLNLVPPALLVLGIGVLLLGVAPRLATPVCYGLVGGSFIVEVLGAALKLPDAVLDLSVVHHMAPVPAEPVAWTTVGAMVVLATGAAAIGLGRFRRRDLVAA